MPVAITSASCGSATTTASCESAVASATTRPRLSGRQNLEWMDQCIASRALLDSEVKAWFEGLRPPAPPMPKDGKAKAPKTKAPKARRPARSSDPPARVTSGVRRSARC